MVRNNRKFARLAILLAWLLPALACNLPFGNRLSEREVQETLAATLFSRKAKITQSVVPGIATTAIPGSSALIPRPGYISTGPEMPVRQVDPGPSFRYISQAGDTLPALEKRFEVNLAEIKSSDGLPATGLIPPGQALDIPNRLGVIDYPVALLPDSEVVYSPTAADFDVRSYVKNAGGFLSTYSEQVDKQILSGAEIIQQIAEDTSIDPRLLLAVLEYRSHWVFGRPANQQQVTYPIGFYQPSYQGLYKEITLVDRYLTAGYYGWRSATFTTIQFTDSTQARLSPNLNAGSVALQNLFAQLYTQDQWFQKLYGPDNFIIFYQQLFGDPWQRAALIDPIFPHKLDLPVLELPFVPGASWSFTGGPHADWGVGSPSGAIDFSPITGLKGCVDSPAWVTASAPGLVVRSDRAVVEINLSGKNNSHTGWVIFYLHIAGADRIAAGMHVNTGDKIGHPSCEGGVATGTNVHIARKYNGEWIGAEEPLPLILSGWQVHDGSGPYLGSLTKGNQVVVSKSDGSHGSTISK